MTAINKKDTTEDAAGSRSNLVLRCGDCMHHKGTPHPMYGHPCNSLGTKSYAAAPNCYTANVTVFRRVSPEVFSQLASITSSFTPQQSRVMMGLFKSAGTLEKVGYRIFDKVYYRLGEDYLDNYYSGYVLGVGMDNNLMIVGASFFTRVKHPMIAHLSSTTVFSTEEFRKKVKSLRKRGLLYVPRKPHKHENVKESDYVPPGIETSRELLEAMAAKGKRKSLVKTHNGVMEIDLSDRSSRRSRSSDD